MMKKYHNILSQLGFSEHASAIYLALLEKGNMQISGVSEHTWLQRIQIYRILPILTERWLVFVTRKWKRSIYSPASPDVLQSEYQELQKNSLQILSEMSEKYKNTQNQTHIIFGRGKKAIENVYHDLLSTLWKGGEFFRITSEVDNERIKKEFQPSNYIEKRDSLGIERTIIMSESAYAQKKRKLEREEKIVSSKDILLDDNIMFTIYGDKISLIDFNKETAIVIESPEMARFQEKIFALLYKKL